MINEQAAREKSIRHGHPSTLHLYWARRPLAAARAVLFAQLVDDPSSHPDKFPTEEAQDLERRRLHSLMERLVQWESTTDTELFKQAAEEIRKSNGGELPAVLDPFAGGGAIPLEAQRLGLEAHASDLNPLAVLINKAMIEIPPRFAGNKPVFPELEGNEFDWHGAAGLAEDIRHYGKWMRDQAEEKIGHLYPKIKDENGVERTVIAWIWARTVRNPNPANPIHVPIVKSWWLSKKKGKEAWIEPRVVGDRIIYKIHHDANGPSKEEDGTRRGRGAVSVVDGTPISVDYLKQEGQAGRMGSQLMAIVAEGHRGRIYLEANEDHKDAAQVHLPPTLGRVPLPYDPRHMGTTDYGMDHFDDLFTPRQITALTTLSDLVSEVRDRVVDDALSAGMPRGDRIEEGGSGAEAYGDAVATYLAFSASKLSNNSSSITSWMNDRGAFRETFSRQALPMVWDFAEINPFCDLGGSFTSCIDKASDAVSYMPAKSGSSAKQVNASSRPYAGYAISTDPPYYDNIGYSDLSDFFYVWLRKSLHQIFPSVTATKLTPKMDELVANPYRHNGKQGAEDFFVRGFNSVFEKMAKESRTDCPMTVYYAYKQQDVKKGNTSSTGWHTLLSGLIKGGWEITATWPMRTEGSGRIISRGTNALASSIILACRVRPEDARVASRREFVKRLREELPDAVRNMMKGDVAAVDLVQAAIGPGMAVFSRYAAVREADGTEMSVRDALELINQSLDEVLGEQETDFDGDTRFALTWWRTYGWDKAPSGEADSLARPYSTSIGQLERGGILSTGGGKAWLVTPDQLTDHWDVEHDDQVSIWEATVRVAGILQEHGIPAAAETMAKAEAAKDLSMESMKQLSFLLFHEAERLKRTQDAITFNNLSAMWGEVSAQARDYQARAESHTLSGEQGTLDFGSY